MKPTDIFISSKGHDALAQYMVLEKEGILPPGSVDTFRQPGGLPSHPTIDIPGIKANTGSLGMGLSKALGFAINDPKRTVWVLLGDGEMIEGQNWEALLAIRNSRTANIVPVVDCNRFSQDGKSALNYLRIERMFEGAGWNVFVAWPGSDVIDLQQLLSTAKTYNQYGDPVQNAVIVPTVKGKGASFEDTWQSHAGPPRDDYSVTHPLYKAFGEAVEELMKEDPLVVLCGADTLRDHNCYHLKDKFPNRVFDFGIAEQNIVSFASALALEKKRPIVVTYERFLSRAFEQIYNQTTERTQVIYVGSLAGPFEEGGPGISHQSLQGHDWMGTMMPVHEFWPSMSFEMEMALEKAIHSGKSQYVRLMHHDKN